MIIDQVAFFNKQSSFSLKNCFKHNLYLQVFVQYNLLLLLLLFYISHN